MNGSRKTHSGTNHVLVTYTTQHPACGAAKSAQAGILFREPSSDGASRGPGPALAFNSRHKHLK